MWEINKAIIKTECFWLRGRFISTIRDILSVLFQRLGIAILVCICFCGHAFAISKDDIVSVVKAYRNQISDIVLRYTLETELVNNDPTRNAQFIHKMDIRIAMSGAKKLIDYEFWPTAQSTQPGRDIRVFNGSITKQHSPITRKGMVLGGEDTYVGRHNYIYELLMWPTESKIPEAIMIMHDLIALLNSEKSKINGEEIINGFQCVVIDFADANIKVWLDLAHGAIPIKREEHYGSNGHLITKFEVTDIGKFGDIYFPIRGTKELYMGHGNPPDTWGKVAVRFYLQVNSEEMKINSGLTDSFFEYSFSPGTFVVDKIAGVTYTTPGERDAILDDILGIAKEQGIITTPK